MAAKLSNEIKKLVYANPDAKPADLLVQLEAAGFKTSVESVASWRSDFLNSIAVLKELGAFDKAAPEATAKPKKPSNPSRSDCWSNACAQARSGLEELQALQEEYEEWKDGLPENLQSSPVADKLEAVCDLDVQSAIDMVDEFDGTDLPLGFGRD